MSSSNFTTHPATYPEIFITAPNDDSEDDFAQTKEDFDVSSIPDSDDSEGGVTIYYQTPDKGKGVDRSANHEIGCSNVENEASFLNLNEDDTTGQELLEPTTPLRSFIPRRFSTPTTDELIKYINDTDLLAGNHEKSDEKSPMTLEKVADELARLREVITRNPIPDAHRTARNSTGVALMELTYSKTQLPLGTTQIRDLATPLPSSILTTLGPRAERALRVKHLPEFQTLHPYPQVGVRAWNGCRWIYNSYTVNETHVSSPVEELYRELSAGEEADDEVVVPPPTPVLGNWNARELLDIGELDGDKSLFQVVPRRTEQSQNLEENNAEQCIAGNASATSSTSPSIPSIAGPRIELPITNFHKEIPRAYQQRRIDAWPTIALAHNIPIIPTHMLTRDAMEQLAHYEKLLQFENGYSSSELDQWALCQHRLLFWINSGALEDGIDGVITRPKSADLLLGFDDSSSELWNYEDVEVYSRYELEQFRSNLEWVQDMDVEGSVESCDTLSDVVYDFCGDDDIIHRSVSVAASEVVDSLLDSSSESILEEYDAEDERGENGVQLRPSANGSHDPRVGRVVNVFRTRELQRLGIGLDDLPFRQPINHNAFRQNGVNAADYARAKARARFDRIAEDFVRRRGAVKEALRGEESSAMSAGQSISAMNNNLRFDGEKVHMRGGVGPGDSGKGSDDKSPPKGDKSKNPLPPSASNYKRSTPSLHQRLQTQVDRIPLYLSIFHTVETLNKNLRVHSSAPGLIIKAATSLPRLISNLLPALAPCEIFASSNKMLEAHEPMSQKILDAIHQIPNHIEQLPSRAKTGISELQKRREERAERQEERSKLIESSTENRVPPKIDPDLLTLEEQIWKNLKENMFKNRRAWEYERDGEDGKKK